MTPAEIGGFITGAICVILVVRQNIWNFPIGIANNLFFIVLFLKAGLYGDMALQFVYIALALNGWYLWLRGGRDQTPLHPTRATTLSLLNMALATILGTTLLWWLLDKFTDSTVPFWDALTTTLSLVAQWMLNRKWIENWFVWITADIIYVGLYIHKDLHLTAILYAMFLCLCIAGFISWNKYLHSQSAHKPDPA